jgi:hypothetical protein
LGILLAPLYKIWKRTPSKLPVSEAVFFLMASISVVVAARFITDAKTKGIAGECAKMVPPRYSWLEQDILVFGWTTFWFVLYVLYSRAGFVKGRRFIFISFALLAVMAYLGIYVEMRNL